jgi:heterodisulfide reductase subunit A
LRHKLSSAENITIKTGCEATKISPQSVTLASGEELKCDAVVIATGFTLFDARIKEEYGYGIYDNVVTSADLEQMFNKGEVRLTSGEAPRRIAILHCVGSRDEKVCQRHCSKVCCVTGVKQAIELKKLFPAADVFNFYMDIRMFGPGYEEMYREAQMNYNIHFVRGRISEVSPTINNRLQIKAEDTLTGRPLKLGVDMLVLLVGMRSNDMNATLEAESGLKCQPSGFMQPKDSFAGNVESNVEGIFYAGAVTAPKNVGESINEGTAAAMAAAEWLAKR